MKKNPLLFRKHWTEPVLWAEDASRGNLNEITNEFFYLILLI